MCRGTIFYQKTIDVKVTIIYLSCVNFKYTVVTLYQRLFTDFKGNIYNKHSNLIFNALINYTLDNIIPNDNKYHDFRSRFLELDKFGLKVFLLVIDHQQEIIFFILNTPDILRVFKTNNFRKVERTEHQDLFIYIEIKFIAKR